MFGILMNLQEGPNPVIINSRDQRKKICSQEKMKIVHGDVLELIPGSFYFKYKSLTFEKHYSSSTTNGSFSTEGKNVNEQDTFSLKRKRPVLDGEACARSMQVFFNLKLLVFYPDNIIHPSLVMERTTTRGLF